MKLALAVIDNRKTEDWQLGRRYFVGKIIGDVFYREFIFSKAVLWQTKEISIDKRAFDFVKDKVKRIVFTDTVKKESYRIGIKKFINNMRVDNYGAEDQCYIDKQLLVKLPKMKKTSYIKDTKVLEND